MVAETELNIYGYHPGEWDDYDAFLADKKKKQEEWHKNNPNHVPTQNTPEQQEQHNAYWLKEYNVHGSKLDYVIDDNGHLVIDYGEEGPAYKKLKDREQRILLNSQQQQFERGNITWGALDNVLKDWYLEHFDPIDIVAATDSTGAVITVAELNDVGNTITEATPATEGSINHPDQTPNESTLLTTETTPAVVTSKPADIIAPAEVTPAAVIEKEGLKTEPVKTTTYNSDNNTSTQTVDYNATNTGLNVPDAYTYTTAGVNNLPSTSPSVFAPLNRSTDILPAGYEWKFDGNGWVQVPIEMNNGGMVKHFNEGGENTTPDFGDINPALKQSLGDSYGFYENPGNLPQWYGTKYVPGEDGAPGTTVGLNANGQTQEEFFAANPNANASDWQVANPIAGFNQNQLDAQTALAAQGGAADQQGLLASAYAAAAKDGVSGNGYNPNLQTATTIGTEYNVDPASYDASTIDNVKAYDPSQAGLSLIGNTNDYNATDYTAAKAGLGQIDDTSNYLAAQYEAAQAGLGRIDDTAQYTPSTYDAATANKASNYKASQLSNNPDYLNKYLNPAANQAQQAAIANVNSSFGQGGTLGGVRNARAATEAAIQASLPTLSQAAQLEFQQGQQNQALNQSAQNQAAQQAVNAQNQLQSQNLVAQNAANQYSTGAINQAGQINSGAVNNTASQNLAAYNQNQAINQAAKNQAAQQNVNAQNQAAQYGAQASNQNSALNLAAYNQNQALNQAAQNQAHQFGATAANQANQFGAQAYNQTSALNQAAANQNALTNSAAQNQAAQYEAQAGNAVNVQNQNAQNQAGQFNAGLSNQAEQYNANVGNQVAAANAGILNQTDAANAGASNTASQFNLGNALAWGGQIPTASNQLLQQGNTLNQVGQQQQDYAQNQLNQDVQAWNYQQALPAQQLQNQLALSQLAAAGQAGNIGYDVGNTASQGFDFGNLLNLGLGSSGGGGGGLGDLFGGLLGFNRGGQVPSKPGLLRRRG